MKLKKSNNQNLLTTSPGKNNNKKSTGSKNLCNAETSAKPQDTEGEQENQNRTKKEPKQNQNKNTIFKFIEKFNKISGQEPNNSKGVEPSKEQEVEKEPQEKEPQEVIVSKEPTKQIKEPNKKTDVQ